MESELNSNQAARLEELYRPEDFKRRDESDDAGFYATDRMVSHLDRCALRTVERIIGSLIVEPEPVILDLMASWDSHLPSDLKPAQVTGLGMNANELAANPNLSRYLVHDLNQDPKLPFEDQTFDVALNVVSVDYLTNPMAVFTEVGRVLNPGGLFLVIFSNRWFEPKVTNIWRGAGENERFSMVNDWFGHTRLFGPTKSFVSKGLPRPADDKYAGSGLPSDPVYAIWAEKLGGAASGARPYPKIQAGHAPLASPAAVQPPDESHAPACPYCKERLRKWQVPQTPFTQWDNEYMYVCFNDHCPYLLRGFEAMGRQGNVGSSYRLMLNPQTGSTGPILVQSLRMLKDGIID